MSRHSVRLPHRGGDWTPDPNRHGLKHRGGNPWDQVRTPPRLHLCAAQTALVWTVRTRRGAHRTGVLWCACGAVTYPGPDGQWIGRNLRRVRLGRPWPAWHTALNTLDLVSPHRSRANGEPDVDPVPGGWRRVGRDRIAAGGELLQPS